MQAVIKQKEVLVYEGQTHTVYLPDGAIAKIRETNGDDDAVLSSAADMDDNSHIHKFLAGITIELDGQTSLSYLDIEKWKNNNKYYLLLKQRIINHGKEFLFKANCANLKCGKESEYEEDLSTIDADLSKESIPVDPNNPNRVWTYPKGKEDVIEFTIPSGKKFQFNMLSSAGESILRSIANTDLNKNTELVIRELKYWDGKAWTLLTFSKGIPSKEMAQIRAYIMKYDQQFNPIVQFNCPFCNTPHAKNMFGIPAFLFPEPTI